MVDVRDGSHVREAVRFFLEEKGHCSMTLSNRDENNARVHEMEMTTRASVQAMQRIRIRSKLSGNECLRQVINRIHDMTVKTIHEHCQRHATCMYHTCRTERARANDQKGIRFRVLYGGESVTKTKMIKGEEALTTTAHLDAR